jgi:hypothetical protein
LARVDVASPFHTEATVNLVATVHAIATDKPIQARSNRFCGGNRFNEYPNLNHVTRFPVVGRGGETSGDDDAVLVFMKDESVQSKPPIHSQNAGMAISKANPSKQSGPWTRGGMRSFMGLTGGRLQGEFNFHL